jgi:hypothetical protein
MRSVEKGFGPPSKGEQAKNLYIRSWLIWICICICICICIHIYIYICEYIPCPGSHLQSDLDLA